MEQERRQQPVDGAALAAKHHLGVPLKRHTHTLGNAVGIGCAVLVVAFCLLLVFAVVGNLIQQPRAILWWLLLLPGILALVRLVLLFRTANQMGNHSVAYECSEGVVVVSGRGQAAHVELALRWDEITRAWKERERGGRRRYGDPSVKYYIRDRHGRQHRLLYLAIWKRCQQELANRDFSEDQSGG